MNTTKWLLLAGTLFLWFRWRNQISPADLAKERARNSVTIEPPSIGGESPRSAPQDSIPGGAKTVTVHQYEAKQFKS